MRWLLRRRPSRLDRVLAAHEAENVLRQAVKDAGPFGGAACGCTWQYLPGGHLSVDLCGVHHAFICTGAHCPDCGEELQDEAFEFWCPSCEAAVPYTRVASEGA